MTLRQRDVLYSIRDKVRAMMASCTRMTKPTQSMRQISCDIWSS